MKEYKAPYLRKQEERFKKYGHIPKFEEEESLLEKQQREKEEERKRKMEDDDIIFFVPADE